MRTFKSMEDFKIYSDYLAKKYHFVISRYNEDYSIDVAKDLSLVLGLLTKIPIQFNKVGGSFWCKNNIGLTSLIVAPRHVEESVYCQHNYNLKSLEGSTQIAKYFHYCNNSSLQSLKGSPECVEGNFHCWDNGLTILEGGPKYVNGSFCCNGNKLTSLKGSPEYVRDEFSCMYNPLDSLEGAPKTIQIHWRIEKEYHSFPEYQRYLLIKKIEAL